ncbi:hypothetical protein [Actinomyces qiguomingii]|uniref:hypothetical protein n=1 Tax=Actinomyces qiguomingii TaxID=2057800 RepID=UPI000CA05DEC|nr:hypothetical protein [Actinomyces qiguomingii]
MTETIIIRPTLVTDLAPGMRVYELGSREITRISRVDPLGDDGPYIVVATRGGLPVRYQEYARVGVIVSDPAPEPERLREPEPLWPTATLVRVLDGWAEEPGDIAGQIAVRYGSEAYYLPELEAHVSASLSYDRIDDWEALSVVPTEAIRTLAARLDELDAADPRTSPGCRLIVRAMRVAEATRALVQVADTGEDAD